MDRRIGRTDWDSHTCGPTEDWSAWLAWSVAALLGITVVLTTFLFRGKGPPVATPVRFEIRLPAGTLNFTLSPDGRQLAFLAPGTDGRNLVWIRALDSLEPRPLPGTENVLGHRSSGPRIADSSHFRQEAS